MKIYDSLEELNTGERTSVALGNFDGIHIGHQRIMEDAVYAAKEQGLSALCFTFSNHPFNFILGRDADDPAAVKLICSEEDKIRLIEEMGFDILVNVPFDETIMKMRANSFFEDILCGKLGAAFISVGFNYSYGARAEGDPGMLRCECEASGIGISVHDAVMLDGEIVSSTLIREMIRKGDMESAKRYLGRPLSFGGTVMHGNKLGSTKGYPTANISVSSDRMLPPNGVYFSRTCIDGKVYGSVSNLGSKPTVSESGREDISAETYIFGFSGDLYGKEISVDFEHFSRAEVKFSSKEALFRQIGRDCESALDYAKKTYRSVDGLSE